MRLVELHALSLVCQPGPGEAQRKGGLSKGQGPIMALRGWSAQAPYRPWQLALQVSNALEKLLVSRVGVGGRGQGARMPREALREVEVFRGAVDVRDRGVA